MITGSPATAWAGGGRCARFAVIAALLVVLAACSGLPDDIAGKKTSKGPTKLTDFKPSAAITIRWRQSVGDMGSNALQPIVAGSAVYAANARGEVFRLDRATGKVVWRVSSGFIISGGVGVGDGLVLVGGTKGELAALGEDGKLRWQTRLTSEVMSAPQVANGIVVVRTGDGRIAGLKVDNDKVTRQWLYERATPALIVRSNAGVTISGDRVYAGFAGGRLAAINLTNGTLIWEVAVSQPKGNTELERISDVTSLPVVDNEQVCAVSFQGRVACFELAQGTLLWSRDLSSDRGLALALKNLYLTDSTGVVSALDKSSGSSLWKNDKLSLRRATEPGVAGNHIAVGDYQGYLHLLSKDDGSFAARLKTDGSAIQSAPAALDDGLLVQTRDGGVYSIAVH
ncbi:MAG: outer membrane protein assembly factor BamB [Pseudomonadota bacterium]